jgi:hypothetical protein
LTGHLLLLLTTLGGIAGVASGHTPPHLASRGDIYFSRDLLWTTAEELSPPLPHTGVKRPPVDTRVLVAVTTAHNIYRP